MSSGIQLKFLAAVGMPLFGRVFNIMSRSSVKTSLSERNIAISFKIPNQMGKSYMSGRLLFGVKQCECCINHLLNNNKIINYHRLII